MARCRSCGADVVWAITEKTGKRMPVDAEPVDNGNIVLVPTDREDGTPMACYRQEDALPGLSEPKHVSHFATCPEREQWRQRAA